MTSKEQIQDLLRFLSKDAKLPLAQAIAKIKPLQDASLTRLAGPSHFRHARVF